jgi:hypothetical protein
VLRRFIAGIGIALERCGTVFSTHAIGKERRRST